LGWVQYWSALASRAPRAANVLTQTPMLAALVKSIAGLAPARKLPPFAVQSFQQWFRARPPRNQDKPAVILWPDTFNNYFEPHTARAAVEVLEAAGRRVVV